MATKRKPPAKRTSQRGSTMYGVLAGLLLGLVVAAGVAFYVTRAPMPFVDRASRDGEPQRTPAPQQAPDPNGGLYGRDGAAGTAPSGPTATLPAPLPQTTPPASAPSAPTAPPEPEQDDLGALIATLPPETPARKPPATPAPAATAPAAGSPAAGSPAAGSPAAGTPAAGTPAAGTPAARSPSAAQSKPGTSGSYYLQAGAYRAQSDAESLRARIILLGLPVAVQRAEVNGAQINRVRVGPFARLDDMNRARLQLGENKIDAAVVRQ